MPQAIWSHAAQPVRHRSLHLTYAESHWHGAEYRIVDTELMCVSHSRAKTQKVLTHYKIPVLVYR